jgi:hypothetical protein
MNAYKSAVWPDGYLIDRNGEVVLHVQGEVNNWAIEEKICTVLLVAHPEVDQILLDPPGDQFTLQCGSTTHETFVGN